VHARLVAFGSLVIDGRHYDGDVVLEGGMVRPRRKKPSKRFRDRYGHTPLSVEEAIPWGGRRLVIGTGMDGALPIMPEVTAEAERRGVELIACPTAEACRLLEGMEPREAYAVLHVTC
jgi:hypothetical protein